MPLSFFTNSGNSYGSAIPFQRIVEPAQLGFFLNLEQAELLRIQRYNEGWRFYFGKHWLFKREDGEPLVTFNYFRKIIDKSVAFLTAKGFNIRTAECLEEVSKPFLDEVWDYNRREQISYDIATTGAVTGDVFVLVTYEEPSPMQKKLNPYSEGHIRVNLLGSEQVYPTWDPLNMDTLIAARIETIYYAERGTRQLDREDRVNHEGRQLYTKRFTQIITRDQIVEQFHGDIPIVRANVLGEIPLVHIRNLSLPKEYYGLPDAQDLIDLQRELNEKATDISDTINYHSAPVTVIFGAKAKQLERGPRQIWSGLPGDARVETLKLEGDLNAAVNYMDRVKKALHELSDIPEGSLGAMQPISNTSGVALHMQYQPLIEKTRRKKAQYEPGLEQVNYLILRIGQAKGLINLPYDLCKHCGGRIIEVATGATAPVWDIQAQAYTEKPITKKRCYKIDKQTLEFLDPYEVMIKFWRQHGFGPELKEMTLRQIIDEIQKEEGSFWDYTRIQKKLLEEWQAKNVPSPTDQLAQAVQGQANEEEGGVEAPQPMATEPEHVHPEAKLPPVPGTLKVRPLPVDEMDVPEEPETVEVLNRFTNPQTGDLLRTTTQQRYLVPTGCKKPAYLNPFDSTVEFNDVLPKDEALQAQLYQQYQTAGWVDEEWCREKIPEIAASASEIKKRLNAAAAIRQSMTPVTEMKSPYGGEMTQYQNQLAPNGEALGAVPGQGGNPVPQGQQVPPGGG